MSENTITVDEVHALFGYDFESGNLYWRRRSDQNASWNKKNSGKIAGTVNPQGYRTILVNRRAYKAHRLVWVYFKGSWPDGSIDHIDGNPSNNRISNLRAVTHQENLKNQPRRRDNSTGATGVYFRKHINKWVARIRADGRDVHLGVYPTREEAIAARLTAQAQHGYHPNHGRAR